MASGSKNGNDPAGASPEWVSYYDLKLTHFSFCSGSIKDNLILKPFQALRKRAYFD
jgi:hypothetical protein